MLFQTPPFFAFFAVFFACYAATMHRLRLQNFVVMVASYIFYAVWDLRFLSLIIVATAAAFVAAQGASGEKIERRQVPPLFSPTRVPRSLPAAPLPP